MRGNEMPGERAIGNLLPGHRSALKKICGLGLFCFFCRVGIFRPRECRRTPGYELYRQLRYELV